MGLLLAGCGVAPAQHAGLARDLEKARSEAASLARRCEDAEVVARKYIDSCDTDRTGAEARARVLENELARMRSERGDLAGDLQAMESRVVELRVVQRAVDDRRRRRVALVERFLAAKADIPELAGIGTGFVGGLLVVGLPPGDVGVWLPRLAEVLRSLPNERFVVHAEDPDRTAAAAKASALAGALSEHGVAASRLTAAAVVGERPVQTLRIQEDVESVPGFEVPSVELELTTPSPARTPAVEQR